MPDKVRTLEILIRLRDKISSNLKKAITSLKVFAKTALLAKKSLSALGSGFSTVTRQVFSLKGAIAGLGLGLLAKSFVNAADSAEGYGTRLKVILGSTKEAMGLFKDMSDFASKVSFTYKDIMESATNLSAVMEGGREEVKKYMPIIADLAATTGLSIQDTTSQVIRMYSAGAAAADMFRERGVLAMLGFQAGVQVSAEETRKRLIAAWEDPASKIRGASTELAKTWSGMLGMLSDAWFQFRTYVMQSGVFDYLKAGLSILLEAINKLKKEGKLKEYAQEISDSLVSGLGKALKLFGFFIDAWRNGWIRAKYYYAIFAKYFNKGVAILYDGVDGLVHIIGKMLRGLATAIDAVDFTGVTKNLTKSLKNAGDLLVSMKGAGDQARETADYWDDIVQASAAEIIHLSKEVPYLVRINKFWEKVVKRAKEYAKAGKERVVTRPKLKPEASFLSVFQSQVSRLREANATALKEMEILYAKGEVSFREYFDKRYQILQENYKKEIDFLEKQAKFETNPEKKLKIEDKIFAVKQKHERELLQLSVDREKAEQDLADAKIQNELLLAEIKERVLSGSAESMKALFERQRLDLLRRQREEIETLKEHKATQDQIEEAYRQHQIERDRLVAQQRISIQEMMTEGMLKSLSYLESAFSDIYEATGKKIKEFFYLQKAASIAQTIISTYQSAQEAYKSLAGIPVIGPTLASVAAATAIAAGLARVAIIRAQSPGFAEGGLVTGKKGKDKILARLTDNEYVMNPLAVKTYGTQFMEAINRRVLKVSDIALPNLSITTPKRPAFAGGGLVSSKSSFPEAQRESSSINIVNVVDPSLLDDYLSTPEGQDAVLNVLSSRASSVRRIIQ